MGIDQPLNIMLADDDPDDRMIFEKAFSELELTATLDFAKNGNDLMEKLNIQDAKIPDILFLDLNMPLMNGFECLQQIKSTEKLRSIFVVICSTSGSQQEVDETFISGADLFMIKQNTFSDLKHFISTIHSLDHKDYITNRKKERFFFKGKSN